MIIKYIENFGIFCVLISGFAFTENAFDLA